MKFIVAFLSLWSTLSAYRYEVAVCALFQNEAPYLREWIEYHKLLGVTHFYLFNHYSEDNYLAVLKPYLADGTVELADELTVADNIKTFYPMQCKCYTDCARKASGESKWVAFIDIDEFIVPMQEKSLKELLMPYEDYGGVGLNWRIFGTNRVKKIPENQLLLEVLTACTEKTYVDNHWVKCIVRPERVAEFENAHMPNFKKGYFGVNTDRFRFEGPVSDPVLENKMRVNHYWTRDEDFFYNVKVPRHKKWGGKANPELVFQRMNATQDTTILRYVPRLKAIISGDKKGAAPP